MENVRTSLVSKNSLMTFLCIIFLPLLMLTPMWSPNARAQGGAPTPTPTPGTPAKMTFDPPDPAVAPGNRVVITPTLRDQNDNVVKCSKFTWIVPENLQDYIEHRDADDKITITGLNPQSATTKLNGNLAPIIAQCSGVTSVVNVRLIALPVAPGPTPPGLKPQVDIMWKVEAQKSCHDNFGLKIKKEYYCIKVTIGNNSGYDLQIASIGFTIPKLRELAAKNYVVPSTGYQMTRGSLLRSQQVGIRNRTINTINALGPFFTGFVPYFHVVNHKANFSQFVNIFSNPFEKGAELVFPDTTINQLVRLDQQAFRNDEVARTIVPNNTSIDTVVFFAKDFFPKEFWSTLYEKNEKTGSAGNPNNRKVGNRDNPMDVMYALGDVVLVGEIVEHLNRVRVIGTPQGTAQFSINGRVVDRCGNGMAGVSIVLTDGVNFPSQTITTDKDGNYRFVGIPSGAIYTITPNKQNVTFPNGGSTSFTLDNDMENINFTGEQASYSISGQIKDSAGKVIAGLTVTLSGGKSDTKTTGPDGSYSFTDVPQGASYTVTPTPKDPIKAFDQASRTVDILNCNQTGINFTAK